MPDEVFFRFATPAPVLVLKVRAPDPLLPRRKGAELDLALAAGLRDAFASVGICDTGFIVRKDRTTDLATYFEC